VLARRGPGALCKALRVNQNLVMSNRNKPEGRTAQNDAYCQLSEKICGKRGLLGSRPNRSRKLRTLGAHQICCPSAGGVRVM
jgi:hypothetical protein